MSDELEALQDKVKDLSNKLWAMQLDMNQLRKALAHSITGIGLVNQISHDTSILLASASLDADREKELISSINENAAKLRDNMAMATSIAWGEHNGGWVYGDEK